MRHSLKYGVAALALLLAMPAQAEIFGAFKGKEAGDFVVRGRALVVHPDPDGKVYTRTGADSGLTVSDIDTSIVPELDLSYFLTDHVALELILATTPHHIKASNGTVVGDAWLLPPTLTVQFHPLPNARFSPYIGAGLNYTIFYGEKSGPSSSVARFEAQNSWGAAIQAGVDIAVTDRWFLNLDLKHIWLSTDVTTASLKAEADIDPTLLGFGFGYRF